MNNNQNNMKNLATIFSFVISFTIILSCKQTSSNEEIKKTDKDTIATNEDTIPTDTTTIIEDNIEDRNKKLDANLVLKDKLIKEKIIKKGHSYSVVRGSAILVMIFVICKKMFILR